MDLPANYQEKFKPARNSVVPRSEWEEQLDKFAEQLNPGRVADGYKPYTHSRIAGILAKAGVHDAPSAYLLFKRCENGNSFSRLFSYLTKV
jgi:hypothetical protein